jgi:uncharacterized protein with GYD domain
MATFISLINWTDQGVKTYKDTMKRADAGRELAQKLGGRIKDLYWTLGSCDLVAISEFPDAESYTAFALGLGSQGNIRTSTLRGYNDDEIRRIIAKAQG